VEQAVGAELEGFLCGLASGGRAGEDECPMTHAVIPTIFFKPLHLRGGFLFYSQNLIVEQA